MPTVEEDLNNGLALSEDEAGKKTLTRVFFCKDLTGGNPVDLFASALELVAGGIAHTGGDIPKRNDKLTVQGTDYWVKTRELKPWPPADADVTVVYTTDPPAESGTAGLGPVTVEVGATLDQAETDFDYANLQLPFASRQTIRIPYDPSAVSPPASAPTFGARVPILLPKPVSNYNRDEAISETDFEDKADAYVGCTNSVPWKGRAKGTVLCLAIIGRKGGDGVMAANYQFARDKHGFKQVARVIDPNTGQPVPLDAAKVAAGNGVKEVTVQGEADFNALAL